MKILFVSHSSTQTVVTVSGLELGDHGYEIHLYNHDNGYTETWTTANDFKDAEFYHKELCKKCGIRIPMKG